MKLSTTFGLLLSVAADASPIEYKKDVFNWNSTKSIIAFGDSYTYVQGTLGRTNATFIGDNFNLTFSPEKLFSNRIVLNQTWANQGTAAGGSNWVEYLTQCGVQKGLTDPQTCQRQLWSFAYGGANTVSEEGFTPAHWNHTVSFEQQIDQFVSYGNPALSTINLSKKDALIAIWIGINDINDLAKLRGKNESFTPLYEKVERHVWENVEKIYKLGYRKYLIMNLPPLDRSPSPSVNASLINTFNNIAARNADAFAARHKDATVLQYDVNTVLNTILDKHDAYGFKNVTKFCPGFNKADIRSDPAKYGCGEGLDTYFWYDSGHLGSRTNKVFSEMLEKWLVRRSWNRS